MNWKEEWANNICTTDDLNGYIKEENKGKIMDVIKRHPMSIPHYYLNLIDKTDIKDPIKKLSVPGIYELDDSGDYDTSGEASNTKFAGLQHKYNTTVLVITTNSCFMYCRHCFRKRMVGYSEEEISKTLDSTLEYIKSHKEINNVLLSGGDSFCLSNSTIKKYIEGLSKIEHLDFIRFGTRSPVVFPERIYEDNELLSILKNGTKNKQIYVVTQFNHPNEITYEAKKSVDALLMSGIRVNNQTVLLKGVNDDPKILSSLLNGLVKTGINPYYVFQCRPVKSVKSSFQLPIIEAVRIIDETKLNLNGFSKRFKFIMSHVRGKIEIIGEYNGKIVFKFHQAKLKEDNNKIFMRDIVENGKWLDENLEFIE
ncbi:MAG: KamA family radical SAM protein [Clostridiaceae bacterium]